MSGTRPPGAATRLVALLADERERGPLLADLDEGFALRCHRAGRAAAVRWYWRQAAILVPGLAVRALRAAAAPGAFRLDVARALRSLRRSPGLTLAGVLTLGIGIAAPTGTFAVIDAMFTRLPVEDAGQVAAVQLVDRTSGDRVPVSLDVARLWDAASGFEVLGAYDTDRAAVSGDGLTPRRVDVAVVASGALDALRVRPLLGRTIAPPDNLVDAAPVVLVSETLWADWFDRDPRALGTPIRVGEGTYDLVGVMPSGFGFPESHDVWTALRPSREGGERVQVVGRLAAGASADAASAELAALLQGLLSEGEVADVDEAERLRGVGVVVDEYVLAYHGRRVRTLMHGLNILIGFLVLIAAANLSAFFLARGATRRAETAVRLAVGGGRMAVVRPLVLEALFVCAAGTALGVTLATYTTAWMAATLEARGVLPYWADFGLSPRLLAFACALMVGATVVTGVWPALRTSRLDLPDALRSGRGRGGPAGARTLSALVGAEVLLACVLLVLTGIVVRAALSTVQTVGAFPIDGVLTAQLVLEDFAYPEPEDRRIFHAELSRRLEEHPNVERISLVSALPGDGTSDAGVALAEAVPDPDAPWPSVQRRLVSPGFFEMFGMEILRGETFGDHPPDSPPVAVVNEAYVREQLGGASPVGRRILVRERGAEPVAHEIVGLVRDPGVAVDDGQRVAAVYLPIGRTLPARFSVALRSGGEPAEARAALQSVVHTLDDELPLDRVMTLEAVIRRENDGGRILGTTFGAVGLGALLLALVGLHGVVSFTTTRRSWDVAVMRALGAPARRVVVAETVSGLRPVGAGLAAGLGFSWFLAPVIHHEMLEGASASGGPHDPFVFGGVALVLLVGGVAAVVVPALRATRVDPAGVMRSE